MPFDIKARAHEAFYGESLDQDEVDRDTQKLKANPDEDEEARTARLHASLLEEATTEFECLPFADVTRCLPVLHHNEAQRAREDQGLDHHGGVH